MRCSASLAARTILIKAMTEDEANPVPPNESLVNVGNLQRELARFAQERDWEQFHSPKNLVMALAGEVGELTELFQWLTEDDSRRAGCEASTSRPVRDELADVLFYLVRLATVLDVDLDEAAVSKLRRNAEKYPVNKARGNSRKYSDL